MFQHGLSAMHVAVMENDTEGVELLFNLGADLDCRTVIHYVIKRGIHPFPLTQVGQLSVTGNV